MMTKRQARALLRFQAAIEKACDSLERQMDSGDLEYAKAYYLSHIRNAANGNGYGSAPIGRAHEALET